MDGFIRRAVMATSEAVAITVAVQPLGGCVVRAFARKLTAMRVKVLFWREISQVGFMRLLGGFC
jgi:hypothetical protein